MVCSPDGSITPAADDGSPAGDAAPPATPLPGFACGDPFDDVPLRDAPPLAGAWSPPAAEDWAREATEAAVAGRFPDSPQGIEEDLDAVELSVDAPAPRRPRAANKHGAAGRMARMFLEVAADMAYERGSDPETRKLMRAFADETFVAVRSFFFFFFFGGSATRDLRRRR